MKTKTTAFFWALAAVLTIGAGRNDGTPPATIDRFGQFTDVDFAQKVRSEAEWKADRESDEAYYRSFSIPDRTFWGGLPGSKEKYGLSATGFFHLEKVSVLGGRTVLVDPEGSLYFHIGMCCTVPGNEFTKVAGREDVYEWLPDANGEFREARWGQCVSFYIANYIRKFGSYDKTAWQKRMIDRCRRWGFNAHGEFTEIFGDNAKLGFAMTKCLEHYMEQEPFHLAAPRFIDPFDEFNVPLLERNFARRTKPFLGKPELIGYYTENEAHYDDAMPALLSRSEPIPARRRFAGLMKQRYVGKIAGFNANWNTAFGSFDEIASSALKPASKQAEEDVAAYEEIFFDAYFKLLGSTLKKVDSDHLYLGERMLTGQLHQTAAIKAMGRYCDIFSVNYYTDAYAPETVERFAALSGRPVMLSEWSFGSPEQGLFGCRNLPNEEERGKAYRRYAENAAASLHVVGFQWFCLLDESNTGRGWSDFYGERFNLGFLNVCDRPYKTFIGYAAKSNAIVYDLIERKVPPVPAPPEKVMYAGTRVVSVAKVKPGIPVDGVRTKYNGTMWEILNRSIRTKDFTKKQDWGGFTCGWDETNFYLWVTMPDRTPAADLRRKPLDQGDCLELFLGADPRVPGRMQPDDRQLLIRVDPGPEPEFLWRNNGRPVATQARPTARCRIAPERNRWEMEVAVPWRELGITPRADLRFRFDLIVDLGGGQGDRIVWNGLKENYFRRDIWATGVLTE